MRATYHNQLAQTLPDVSPSDKPLCIRVELTQLEALRRIMGQYQTPLQTELQRSGDLAALASFNSLLQSSKAASTPSSSTLPNT